MVAGKRQRKKARKYMAEITKEEEGFADACRLAAARQYKKSSRTRPSCESLG